MAIDLGEVTGLTASREKKKENVKIANGLDKDAFMKLFLEQLKNQDPTAPMETDKIIAQTAQLTQVEMQEENKKAMKEVAQAMKETEKTNKSLQEFQTDMKKSLQLLNEGLESSTNATISASKVNSLNAMSMIGKIAETNINGLEVTGSGTNNFSLYFDNKIDSSKGSPVVEITNQDKEVIKTISLADKNGQDGYINFSWDGKDNAGNLVPKGNYLVLANYNLNSQNQYESTRLGRGIVHSIIYEKGVPLLRMENNILPLQSAVEFYEKGDKTHIPKSIESTKSQATKILDQYEKKEQVAKDKNIEETKTKEEIKKETKEVNKYEKMLDEAVKNRKQIDTNEFAKLGTNNNNSPKDLKDSDKLNTNKLTSNELDSNKLASPLKNSPSAANNELSNEVKNAPKNQNPLNTTNKENKLDSKNLLQQAMNLPS